jgi:hypothetical protein
VVVTGDIVEHTPCLDWVPLSLGRIASPVRLFVLGNHDRKVGHENVRRVMAAAGFCDLGSRCQLVGQRNALVRRGPASPLVSQRPARRLGPPPRPGPHPRRFRLVCHSPLSPGPGRA